MGSPIVVSAVVEGPTDAAAAEKLLRHAGLVPGTTYEQGGKTRLVENLPRYNRAAVFGVWLTVVDLDRSADCAPPFVAQVLPNRSSSMTLRVAVRALEAWLLADPAAMASFLSVAQTKVPRDPDALLDPKRALVELAARSRSAAIREDMVPRPGSGRSVGPAYTSRLIELITQHWSIDEAVTRSDSLNRCVKALQGIRARHP